MESDSCTNICRFCLETSNGSFETIQEVTLANLHFLWLKLNLTINEEPVMCGDCGVTIKTSSDFKTKCLEIENCIMSSVKDKDSIKIDLREIYMSKMSLENIVNVPEDHIVCRLCLKLVKNDGAIFLRNSTDIVERLEQYFPELDLTCTNDPVICGSCQVSLQSYFNFINTCLTTEEKINEYCKVDGINGVGQIDLNSLIHFILSKDFVNCKIEVGPVKIEETYNEDNESANNDVEIKKEEILNMELDIKEDSSAQESKVADENSFQHHPPSSQSYCVPQLTRARPAAKYTCEICGYQNNRRRRLQEHMHKHNTIDLATRDTTLKHKTLFEYICELCDYKTERQSDIVRHMLTHKSPSETTMYKCESCSFATKYKSYLHLHMLVHGDESEIEMHKCEECPFKTKWKRSLRGHLRSHRKTPNVVTRREVITSGTIHKCHHCDYETRRKSNLRSHMLTHKIPSETTMYKCETCTFETKRKNYLQHHMLIHMDVSEIDMHKCEVCPFKTKRKGCLQRHIRSHKNPPATMYKCQHCNYEARQKSKLNRHMLTHKTPSETALHKCETCTLGTKHNCLQHHMLTHMDKSKIEIHKCKLCPYETKWERYFQLHMFYHMNPSDVVT